MSTRKSLNSKFDIPKISELTLLKKFLFLGIKFTLVMYTKCIVFVYQIMYRSIYNSLILYSNNILPSILFHFRRYQDSRCSLMDNIFVCFIIFTILYYKLTYLNLTGVLPCLHIHKGLKNTK